MIVLIPAYEPDARLVDVVSQVRGAVPDSAVLVVDDGSGPSFESVFDAARDEGAEVIGYDINQGKGHALKTGFRHILDHDPGQDVVCADSDGQHSTADIVRVAERVREADGAMVLGGRRFTGRVPVRSRFGNAVARLSFRLTTGFAIRDTQSGLRGYPRAMLGWLLTVKGERFEYELNTLLSSGSAGQRIDEVEIETIYLEENRSSHFRPIADSLRVMLPFLLYGASSLAAFAIDFLALQVLFGATASIFLSVVGARLLSGSVNFVVNRFVVFRPSGPRRLGRAAGRYVALAVSLLIASFASLEILTQLGLALVPAKLLTDVALYVVSYQVQKRLVFSKATHRRVIGTT